MTILESQLDATDMFKNTEIYIDEFVGFTKQEYAIIAKLLKQASKVTITVTSNSMEKTDEASNDIFSAIKKQLKKY